MPAGKPQDLFNRILWVVLAFGVLADQPEKDGSYVSEHSSSESSYGFRGPTPSPTRPAHAREANVQQRLQYLKRFTDPTTGSIPSNVRALEMAFARQIHQKQNLQSRQEQSLNVLGRGPRNLGGRTRALGVDVRDDRIILAGGVSGGMWKSMDQGDTWEYTTLPTQLPSVTCLIQDTRPGKLDNWYYGSGEYKGNSASSKQAPFLGDGIFHSSDNGDSWEQLASTRTLINSTNLPPVPLNYVHRLAIDASNFEQDEIYVAVPYGIMRTMDGFQSPPQYVLGGEPTGENRNWTEVIVTPTGRVYATISNEENLEEGPFGIFTSEDGVNWQNITPPTRYDEGFRRVVMAYAPSAEHIVYFLGERNNVARLHQYNAITERWIDLTPQIPLLGGLVGNFDTQGSYNMVIAVHPQFENHVFIGGTNLHLSTSGFTNTENTTWIGGYSQENDLSQFENHHADQHALVFDSQNRLVSGHDGGVSILENPLKKIIRWRSLNNGYGTTQAHSVGLSTIDWGSKVRMAGFQDLGTFFTEEKDTDLPWIAIGTGDGGFTMATPTSLLVSWQYGQLYRYGLSPETGEPNGEEQSINPPDAGTPLRFPFVTPWVVDPDRPNRLFLAGVAGLWRLEDVTKPFSSSDWALTEDRELIGDISSLGFATGQPNLWVGTEVGHVYKVENHLQSQIAFASKTSDLFPDQGYVSSVSVHPNRSDEVWVAFSSYGVNSLFRTLDGGETWEGVGGNLDESFGEFNKGPGITWITMLARGEETFYFAGTTAGLYYTTTVSGNATQWIPIGINEIGVAVIDMITVNPVDGTVLVATHGKGLFEFQVPDVWEPRVAVIGPDPVCLQETTVLYATHDRRSERMPIQYQWYKNGELISGENQSVLITEEPGDYYATIMLPDGSPSRRTSYVTLPDKVPENFELVRVNDSLVVEPGCDGCQYEWVRDDNSAVAITSDPTLFVGGIQIDGNYKVRVTRGCNPVESNTITVEGISLEPGETDKLVIVPNPATDQVTLKVLASDKQVLGARLYTLNGQLISEKNDAAWNEWDLTALGRGMYQMVIFGEDGIISSSLLMKR
ncbi:MAG TPA: hypothetical protein DCE41_23425 [Cytophagales bacterium]|nr:hypothetical protein [Cytophagales bacterium]HAA23682.1 hypothetical protein [Cytophagales bacterium]HAP59242.1 hypothetical protein [Cytophagales bacterium]